MDLSRVACIQTRAGWGGGWVGGGFVRGGGGGWGGEHGPALPLHALFFALFVFIFIFYFNGGFREKLLFYVGGEDITWRRTFRRYLSTPDSHTRAHVHACSHTLMHASTYTCKISPRQSQTHGLTHRSKACTYTHAHKYVTHTHTHTHTHAHTQCKPKRLSLDFFRLK